MLISHEVPISLLNKSKTFNDYDYCLLHLTYERPGYRQYYIDAIKQGRKVLLDNSLFELGDALTNEQLAQGVLDLLPTWYVVPDCLGNATVTMDRFDRFIKDFSGLPGIRIGVAQGSTLEELVECYKYMSDKADKIAIPFDLPVFVDMVPEFLREADILQKWCVGREAFIEYLVRNGIWNNDKPHHLLGCSLAREFSDKLYRSLSIESIDTSNPVVAAISGLKYDRGGLRVKPSIKLCDLIDHQLTQQELELLEHNVKTFRSICND